MAKNYGKIFCKINAMFLWQYLQFILNYYKFTINKIKMYKNNIGIYNIMYLKAKNILFL